MGDVATAMVTTNMYHRFNSTSGLLFGGLYPMIASIRYSCRPNAAVFINEVLGSLDLYALEALKPNEEITIAANSATLRLPTARRREIIMGLRGYKCECPRCLVPLPNDALLTSARGKYDGARASAMKHLYDACFELQNDPKSNPFHVIATLKRFLFEMDLDECHWRCFEIRFLLIEELRKVQGHAPTFRKDLCYFLRTQIRCEAKFFPELSNARLRYLEILKEVDSSAFSEFAETWKELQAVYSESLTLDLPKEIPFRFQSLSQNVYSQFSTLRLETDLPQEKKAFANALRLLLVTLAEQEIKRISSKLGDVQVEVDDSRSIILFYRKASFHLTFDPNKWEAFLFLRTGGASWSNTLELTINYGNVISAVPTDYASKRLAHHITRALEITL